MFPSNIGFDEFFLRSSIGSSCKQARPIRASGRHIITPLPDKRDGKCFGKGHAKRLSVATPVNNAGVLRDRMVLTDRGPQDLRDDSGRKSEDSDPEPEILPIACSATNSRPSWLSRPVGCCEDDVRSHGGDPARSQFAEHQAADAVILPGSKGVNGGPVARPEHNLPSASPWRNSMLPRPSRTALALAIFSKGTATSMPSTCSLLAARCVCSPSARSVGIQPARRSP